MIFFFHFFIFEYTWTWFYFFTLHIRPVFYLVNFFIPNIPKTDFQSPQIVESNDTLGIAIINNVSWMYPFLYLLYNSKLFASSIRQSLWCRGSMQGSYAKGLWIKSKSSQIFYFFCDKIFFPAQISYFQIQIIVKNKISHWY